MPSREDNLAAIASFLRDRSIKARQVRDSLKAMNDEQRRAVMTQSTFDESIKTRFNIRELDARIDPVAHLDYHKIRYSLIGKDEAVYSKQGQPKALLQKGIVIDYSEGKRKPKFYFDSEVMLSAMGAAGQIDYPDPATTPPLINTEPEPDVKPDLNEPAPVPVNVECDLIHVQGWLRDAIGGALNVNELGTDENNIVMVNGSPLVGVFYASADWAVANGYSVDDATAISHNTDLVKREELQE